MTEPKMIWRRIFAIVALTHFCYYTLTGGVNPWVIGGDLTIIAYWALGAAGLIDALKVWKG